MSSIFCECAVCQSSTLHRSPQDSAATKGRTQRGVQCDVCGTIRELPADAVASDKLADATRLLSLLPALSQKSAHGKLEELLYDHRAAIEESNAYGRAVAAADANTFELQDIKVSGYRREQSAVIADFTYYALSVGEPGNAEDRVRIDGSGNGRIDDQGGVEIRDLTAILSSS